MITAYDSPDGVSNALITNVSLKCPTPVSRPVKLTNWISAVYLGAQNVCDWIEDQTEEIDNILGQTTWDITPIDQLRPLRNKLCELLGVPPPAVVKKPVL